MKRALKWIGGGLLLLIVALVLIGYAPDSDPVAMRARYAGPPSQFIAVGGGLTMHVRDQGKRPTATDSPPVLVLLHGSNASLHPLAIAHGFFVLLDNEWPLSVTDGR